MREAELTPRLLCAANFVPAGARFADVGTDHAYLPVWLLQHGVIGRAIASDIREGPLSRARASARTYGCEDRMDFRLCPGLTGIGREEVDTVAIAGMGGEMIAGILDAAPWTREQDTCLVLQPMSSVPELRAWLAENGYRIRRERLVREGQRIYLVLLAGAGEQTMSAGECWVGCQDQALYDPLRGEYLRDRLGRLDRAVEGLKSSGHEEERLLEMEKLREEVSALLKQWESWHGK